MLYVAGPAGLLERRGVAVVGSRNVADEGAAVAQAAARAVAARGDTLVSGGAKGVDQLAMGAAIQAGAHAVGVLADALARRLRDPGVRRAISGEQLCLVTPSQPTAGFSVASAMGRNKVIYALADVTLVVAADAGRGGAWEGAVESLRRGFGPVAVWSGQGGGAGNDLLIGRGARPIADLRQLFDGSAPEPAQPVEQLQLGV